MTGSPDHAPRRHRRRGPNRRGGAAPVNLDRWIVSYADFVTLLFAFFTTMYAISKVDAAKLSTMVSSMNHAFVPGKSRSESGGGGGSRGNVNIPPDAPGEFDVRAEFERRLKQELTDGQVSLEVDSRGVVISMLESGSFPVGSADLTPEARDVLSKIASTIAAADSNVRIEGHTDDVPIHTARFASNWELSTTRATSVVQYLIATAGLPASRLSASGYGEFHPRVPNDTAENRTRNRRVDVIILNAGTSRSEEPPARSSSPAPTERPR
jgi:chemotaxis protein MotB